MAPQHRRRRRASRGRGRRTARWAARGSLLYFLVDSLPTLDRCYHHSMAAFLDILRKGMAATPGGRDEAAVPEEQRLGMAVDLPQRVALLIATTSLRLFRYASQGLFERHKLLVAAQLCLATLRAGGRLHPAKLDFLLAGAGAIVVGGGGGGGEANPLAEWVSPGAWGAVALRSLPDYGALTEDLAASAKRWRRLDGAGAPRRRSRCRVRGELAAWGGSHRGGARRARRRDCSGASTRSFIVITVSTILV